jgi:acid phosphatase (class A)
MKRLVHAALAIILAASLSAAGQTPAQAPAPAKESKAVAGSAANSAAAQVFDLLPIVPPPPAQDSEATKAELAELHQIEQTRTPAQVAAALADNGEEDMFIYRTVLGDKFRPEDLPLTAALSKYVNSEVIAADNPLKAAFKRPRPYQADPTLHPACPATDKPTSYPSGHSFVGYLQAFTLIEMIPEKRDEILKRADDYAHNRMVCGVHYRSDTVTSHELAYAVFGYMMSLPQFQTELAAARAETRKRLGLN